MVGSQKFIFLDIKSDKIFDHEFCSKITELINKYHLEERVIVESFNPFFLALMRLNSRNILLVYNYITNSQAGGEEIQTQLDQIPWILKQPFFQKQIRRMVYNYITNSQAGGEEIQTQLDQIPWILKQPFFQKQIRRIIRPDMLGIRFNTPLKLIKPLIDHGYPIMIWTVDDKQIAEDFF